jgi:hypothetical protein
MKSKLVVSLTDAKKWYYSDSEILKEIALRAFSEEEIINPRITLADIKLLEKKCFLKKLVPSIEGKTVIRVYSRTLILIKYLIFVLEGGEFAIYSANDDRFLDKVHLLIMYNGKCSLSNLSTVLTDLHIVSYGYLKDLELSGKTYLEDERNKE